MQGKIVIQGRLKHAVMNRPGRAALGNSVPPFALPAGGPALALPLSGGGGGGQQPSEAARFPPTLLLLPPGRSAGPGAAGPGSPPPPPAARLPELSQAAFTRGIYTSPFSPVLARTGAEVGNETPAKGRFIVP